MALTDYYVDPSIAGDSGAGTSGDPYGDLEYALEQITRDSTNGDRINIKAGTDEILEFALDIVTDYGTPTQTAPLCFQGYTTTAGDGGKGGISGGGSVSIIDATTLDYILLIDLHMHNTGSSKILNLDRHCHVFRCELDNSTGTGNNVELGAYSTFIGNHVHNHAGTNYFTIGSTIMQNYFANGTNDFVRTIQGASGLHIFNNIIDIDGATIGILLEQNAIAANNSIYSNGGTGQGITVNNSNIEYGIMNNLVEGFSGAGGKGIETKSTMGLAHFYGNSIENCTTDIDASQRFTLDTGLTNESLSASPFTNASTQDFSPVDTGAVKEGSLPDDFGDGAI